MTGGGIDHGFCYDIHVFSFLQFTCMSTAVSIFNSMVCFFMFGYCLRKMQSNHRRALAGYTKNTINIDIHMNLMMAVAIWCLVWGIYELFDFPDDLEDKSMDGRKYRRLFGLTRGLIFGFTSFLECAVLLLLCSPSVGFNAFRTYWVVSSSWGLATFLSICLTTALTPGESNYVFSYRNYVMVIILRSALTIGFNVFTLWYFGIRSSNERPAVIRYSNYLIFLYSATLIGNLCLVSRRSETANFGLCLADLTEIVHFGTFASVVYLALKRDCQYWSSGFGEEEEEEKMTFVLKNDELTWSELPNYKDVVIPKTELFFRSKLQERLDITVETHLWRRQIVVVKRFRFDFLTKDNIKYFKKEANIFKVLKHEHIVKFFGVVIDPPSLGIVMQYGANGDLFENLDKLRKEHVVSLKQNDQPPKRNKRASIRLDETYYHQQTDDSDNCGSAESQKNPMQVDAEEGGGVEDDDNGRERSTLNWSLDPRHVSFSTRIAQTLSSVAGNSRNNMHASSDFEPLVCMHQVVQGMSYLHSQNVTHSDLKSLNVLLDEEYNAKITDFGESSFEKKMPNRGSSSSTSSTGVALSLFSTLGGSARSKSTLSRPTSGKYGTSSPDFQGEPVGTPGWAAPEAIEGRATRASDVFGFGTMLWEVLTWRAPSLLISIDMLNQEPLCFMPVVVTAVHEYCESTKRKKSFEKEWKPKTGRDIDTEFMMDERNSMSMHRLSPPGDMDDLARGSMSVDSGTIRERKKNETSKDRASAAKRPSVEKRDLGKKAFSSVFSKFGPSSGTAANPNIMGTVNEMAKKLVGDELILVEVSDMEFAYETMCVRGLRPPLPVGLPPELEDLLQSCWDFDIKNRPTFPQILTALDKYFKTNPESLDLPLELSNEVNFSMTGAPSATTSYHDSV